MIAHNMTTTQFELDGYEVKRSLGIVRGIIVRSRSVLGTIGASLQTLVGGNITLLTELCEKTRNDSFELMLQHAAQLGANAVVGVRYDATEVMQGVTEVRCYGTAVSSRTKALITFPARSLRSQCPRAALTSWETLRIPLTCAHDAR